MLRHSRTLKDSQGFTLIELLIVVVIIGILAAIAIPQFASTKEKAFDATAKSDLRNLMSAQEAYFADNLTTYGTLTELTNADLVNASDGVTLAVSGQDADGYEATAKHTGSDATWCVNTDPADDAPGEIEQATDC